MIFWQENWLTTLLFTASIMVTAMAKVIAAVVTVMAMVVTDYFP
ncbi:hypothetical protein [Selenomonas ruminantium]|nr:hypothetical protein [Selenomonas ruminantium]